MSISLTCAQPVVELVRSLEPFLPVVPSSSLNPLTSLMCLKVGVDLLLQLDPQLVDCASGCQRAACLALGLAAT